MIKRIREIMAKIRERAKFNRCYDGMEKAGVAVFGMCSGFFLDRPRVETCTRCPYFRDVYERTDSEPSILYLCDRAACSDCNNIDCYHTGNIEHAVNFEKIGNAYWEKERNNV